MEVTKITKEKDHSQYNNNISKLFHLLTYKKADPIVMGSNAMKFYYGSDYDLFSIVQTHESLAALKKNVYMEFKKMMQNILMKKDVYFIELLAGVDADGKSLKWRPKELIKGFQKKDGKIYKFMDILNEESIIKIEIVGYVPGVGFIPVSNAYEFQTSDGQGINHEKITVDTVASLKKDIQKFHEKKNLMKILKRLFIISLTEKNKTLSEKLINIFNGDIGRLYKVKSDLEGIGEVILEYHDKPTMDKAYHEIQKLKEYIGVQIIYLFKKDFYKKFDRISLTKNYKTMGKLINVLCEEILKIVNKLLKQQIKKDKINYEKYL